MSVIAWVMIALYVLSGLVTVARIGKPAKPVTPGVAVASLVVCALMILGIITISR